MIHRGPDDAGEWWSADARVGLAHRRLSIIDLTTAGHQPMKDISGELCIVFNGEIYNFHEIRDNLTSKGHSFHSHSDTEVILAAYREWGTNCLDHLDGMFAFALYDNSRRRIFMARDRAGEKPLFYFLSKNSLRFASELKGLLADPDFPRRIDTKALDCYLAMGYVPREQCILQGVSKLPPSHALIFELVSGHSQVWRYWHPPESDDEKLSKTANEEELLDEFETLLESAVRRQLVADVPVGVLLSGGVDSSLITAMAMRVASAVKTFTIRFPGHSQHDETHHARLIAKHFQTDHTELEAGESTADILPLLARQYDEPIADSSMIPTYLLSRLVRQHCTVALGGDGGDELFGGYLHYNRLLWIEKYLSNLPRPLHKLAATLGSILAPEGFSGKKWLQALAVDLRTSLPLFAASRFDRSSRRSLMSAIGSWSPTAESIHHQLSSRDANLLQRATRTDFACYLPEDILVKVDRASMLNSLEIRAPLLDRNIIEFSYRSVPARLKATTTERKILLKKLTTRLLPPEFDRQRKQGFTIPLGSWLKTGPWNKLFHDVLLGSAQPLFSRSMTNRLLKDQARGMANSERLFALVVFELWRQEYRISI